MDRCIFCDILAGKAQASVVHQDERCTAFMDIQPVNPGHVLIVPNRHAPFLADLDPDTGAQMFRVARRVAGALRTSGLRCEGVNLWLADGEVAFQDVFHVHLHVIPRFKGDGFGLKLSPSYYDLPPRAELDAVAAKVQANLQHE